MLAQGIKAVGKIKLKVLSEDRTPSSGNADFQVDAPGVEGYIVGRSDAASNYLPDIDLAPYGAQQKGISRRHAALVRYRDLVHVIDLGSMNGTFVNGKRLPANVVCPLNVGDQLSFANLDIIITPMLSAETDKPD